MKTIQFTGTEDKIDNLHLALGISDNDMPQQSEVRVYIVNEEDSKENPRVLTDSDFMDLAETFGRVYTIQGFQEAFNNTTEITDCSDVVRFINVTLYL